MINRLLQRIFKKNSMTSSSGIKYKNWWDYDDADAEWFTQFIDFHFSKKLKNEVIFFSVFGNRATLKNTKKTVKVFYTGENLQSYVKYNNCRINTHGSVYNLHKQWNEHYSDNALAECNLALGFDNINDEKYLRFPIWIWRCFSPTSTFYDIKKRIEEINSVRSFPQYEALVVASHDDFGTRGYIWDDVSDILSITSAGKWKNNTTKLWDQYPQRDKYGRDKIEFMKNYKFNICPENMDAPYYVTEKIFDAFQAGSIPIYHGALNNPEPNIISKDAVIFWDFEGSNEDNKKLIRRLLSDEHFYYSFMRQEKFKKGSAEYIYNIFEKLRDKFEVLLNSDDEKYKCNNSSI